MDYVTRNYSACPRIPKEIDGWWFCSNVGLWKASNEEGYLSAWNVQGNDLIKYYKLG